MEQVSMHNFTENYVAFLAMATLQFGRCLPAISSLVGGIVSCECNSHVVNPRIGLVLLPLVTAGAPVVPQISQFPQFNFLHARAIPVYVSLLFRWKWSSSCSLP